MNIELPLSVPALRYAVEMCEANPDYKVGVAVSDSTQFDAVIDTLTDYVDWCKFAQIGNIVSRFISWKNGSRVYVEAAKECSRGHRWNMLILGEDVDNKVYRNVLRHCNTRPYPVSG